MPLINIIRANLCNPCNLCAKSEAKLPDTHSEEYFIKHTDITDLTDVTKLLTIYP